MADTVDGTKVATSVHLHNYTRTCFGVPLAPDVQCCVAESGRRVRSDETRKLRNTDSSARVPILNSGGKGVGNICLFVFLLLCDACVHRFVDVANFLLSTVVFFSGASCCTFSFVDLAWIGFVLWLFVLFAGVSAMPPTARMTSEEKRIAYDMHERGFIPSHIADHLLTRRNHHKTR